MSEAAPRELQGPKLKVEYELVTTDLSEATAVEATLADPTAAAQFAADFSTALVEKEAEAGRTVVVKEIVPEAATVTSETVEVIITPPPTPAPGSPVTPAPTPPPTPAPPAPTPSTDSPAAATPAPTPAAATEEEEESDSGALIGGVVGGV